MIGQTLLIIKPNAFAHRHAGHIISLVEEAGFFLRQARVFTFTPEAAAEFYHIHQGKEFFDRLIKFTCSAPVFALLLEKENAVQDLRKLVGEADPAKREAGTIRDIYAEGITANAVHASDSIDNAKLEIGLVFPQAERYM